MSAPLFKVGDRVRLLPFEEVPEEKGTVQNYEDGFYYVAVDAEYLQEDDDGLREIFEEDGQMEPLV